MLDHVYRALLAAPELRLAGTHRQQLHARGLDDASIELDMYRSLPARCRAGMVRRLQKRFDTELLLTVPGIVVKDGPHGRYLTVSGLPGLLVPVVSVAEQMVGVVVRPDDPGEGGKYRWLSTGNAGARVHVPAGNKASARAVIVEGSLKANVCVALADADENVSGRAIIGLPGCIVTTEAISTLRELDCRDVLLALDADVRTNPTVARAQRDGLALLNRSGFTGGILCWPADGGKGLDDLLLTMHMEAVA
jgi:hypothetical protein